MSDLQDSLIETDQSTGTTEESAKEDDIHGDSKSDQSPDEKSPDAEEKASKDVSDHDKEKDSSSDPLEGAVGGIDLNEEKPLQFPDCESIKAEIVFPDVEKPLTYEQLLIADRILKNYLEKLRRSLRTAVERAKDHLQRLDIDWKQYAREAIQNYGFLKPENRRPINFRQHWEEEYFLPRCDGIAALIQTVHLSRCIVHDDIVKIYNDQPELRKSPNALRPHPEDRDAFEDDSEEHIQFVHKRRENAEAEEQVACIVFNYGHQLTSNQIVSLQNSLAKLLNEKEFQRVSVFTQEALSRSDGSDHSSADAPDLPVDDQDGNKTAAPTEKSSSSDNIPPAPSSTPTKEAYLQLPKKPCPFDRKDSLANIPSIPADETPEDKSLQLKPKEELKKSEDTTKDSPTHVSTDEEKSGATVEDLTGDEDSNPIDDDEQKKKLYRTRPTNQDEGNDTST